MKIAVIGTGYVGLVTGVVFASLGNEVICVDRDKNKIAQLKRGSPHFFEPGLEELLKKNLKKKRIDFTTSISQAVKKSKIIFIAVGTPSKADGGADLSQIVKVAQSISKSLNGYKIIVNKSTVPIGTGDYISKIIKKNYKGEFGIVSNPEFLREGSAVHDALFPDRIVIGDANPRERKIMRQLYSPYNCPIVFCDIKTAEMIKYASNSFLACSISFINSIANICEKVGADVERVAEGMRLDKRIGKHSFLSAGVGYGGSCFGKDVKALIQIAKNCGFDFGILKAVEEVNKLQKKLPVKKLKKLLGTSLSRKKIAIWGLAFKPKTDDIRDAVSLTVIEDLFREKARIYAYDPAAQANIKKLFPFVKLCSSAFEAAKGAEALIILTEWDEFKQIDKERLKGILKKPIVFDGRNIFDLKEMKKIGFKYLSVGRV